MFVCLFGEVGLGGLGGLENSRMSGFLTRFAPACPCPQELFMMRKNVKTRQQVKPHLFMHTKHRVAQLQSLLSQRQAA